MSTHPNASRSGTVCYQIDEGNRRPTRSSGVAASHARNGSGSSVGSTSSTASFFASSPSRRDHRHTDSDASSSSVDSGVQSPDKRRTAELPTASAHMDTDDWALRSDDDPRKMQIAEDLNQAVIHAGLKDTDVRSMLRVGQSATVPSTNVMRIRIAGLTGYVCEVRPRSPCAFVTSDDVVFALVPFLRTRVTKQEARVLNGQGNPLITEESRRYDVLPRGEETRLEGFTLLDAGENVWRLGR